jgi:hypothetical protein
MFQIVSVGVDHLSLTQRVGRRMWRHSFRPFSVSRFFSSEGIVVARGARNLAVVQAGGAPIYQPLQCPYGTAQPPHDRGGLLGRCPISSGKQFSNFKF